MGKAWSCAEEVEGQNKKPKPFIYKDLGFVFWW